MKTIKCTLPNASHEINGVKFAPADGGVVSDPVADDVAAHFAKIPGYEISEVKVAEEKPAAKVKAKAEADETKK